jgi:hypothetical protein
MTAGRVRRSGRRAKGVNRNSVTLDGLYVRPASHGGDIVGSRAGGVEGVSLNRSTDGSGDYRVPIGGYRPALGVPALRDSLWGIALLAPGNPIAAV